ncbi:MAG: EF-hand domain-containing protein [Alphaproteobacteria bacterium]|nr:EF-hand domain-containing protein [Alphaproteobacteria bacterium]
MSISISGIGSSSMPSMVSGASPYMASPQQKMSGLYNKIDASGSGSITQSQFNTAFQTLNPPTAFKNAGASAVWNALDPSGSGQVSQQDFINGMKNLMVQLDVLPENVAKMR